MNQKRIGLPTGDLPPLYPGQVERVDFNLEQMKALSSPVRAEVFWLFHANIQKSVNDIAKEIGKSAQTVHYHVNALLELGLIVPAETRRRRSRTEQLYLRKGRSSFDPTFDAGELFNRYRVRAFKLELLRMIEEDSHFWGLLDQKKEIIKFATFRKYRLRLTPERADRLRWDMVNLLVEAFGDQTPTDQDGTFVNTVVYMRPTVGQLKAWAEELNIPYDELSRDGIPSNADE